MEKSTVPHATDESLDLEATDSPVELRGYQRRHPSETFYIAEVDRQSHPLAVRQAVVQRALHC